MILEHLIQPYIIAHLWIISFIAGALSEEALLLLSILAGQGIVPLSQVVLFGLLGILFADSAWFLVSTSYPITWLFAKLHKHIGLSSKERHQTHLSHKQIVTLFTSKFIYGTRIPTIVYLGRKRISYFNFLKHNLPANLLFAVVMIPLGWLAGRGFAALFNTARGIEKVLAIILAIVIIIYILNKIVSSRFRSQEKTYKGKAKISPSSKTR